MNWKIGQRKYGYECFSVGYNVDLFANYSEGIFTVENKKERILLKTEDKDEAYEFFHDRELIDKKSSYDKRLKTAAEELHKKKNGYKEDGKIANKYGVALYDLIKTERHIGAPVTKIKNERFSEKEIAKELKADPKHNEVLAVFRSKSNPKDKHKVFKYANGSLYCDCIGFSIKHYCQHIVRTKIKHKIPLTDIEMDFAERKGLI